MSERVAIITAASQGMGKACAEAFSQAGYKVLLMSRTDQVLKVAQDLGGIGFQGTVDDTNDLKNLVDRALSEYGRIDVVVNNTGHPPKGQLLELTDEDWQKGSELVLMNVVRMARLVTPVMKKQGCGSIINISTYAAYEPSLKFPISSVMRAALGAYTKLYADEYGADSIRMNNILPGFIESYPIDDATRDEIPMKRSGKLAEIGETAVFLASEAAGYITGENLKVDGGLSKCV